MGLKHIFLGHKDIFGLDVGTSCVSAVWLRKDDGVYRVIAAGRTRVVHGGSGHLSSDAFVVKAIRECVKSANIKTRYAVCSLSGSDIALRRFEFPAVSDDELANAVLFEAEQVCPFEEGQFIVDYQLMNNNKFGSKKSGVQEAGGLTRGILVAAMADVIGRRNQLARKSALNCVLMDIDGLALLNCYSECEDHVVGQTTALLRIGDNFSNLVILPDGGLPFVRDIPHASTEIIGRICTEHVSFEAIGDTFYGWRQDGRHDQAIRNGMEAACTPLIAELTETLRYYALHEGQAVDTIYVCGYLGVGEDLCNLLDSRLSPKVVIWNPFDKMRCDSSCRGFDIIKAHGPSLALAAGLAMRTI